MADIVARLATLCYGADVILSFFERKDSPYVWAQYCLEVGKRKRYEKTNIRKDEAHKRQKLARYRSELEERLLAEAESGDLDPRCDNGWNWVLPWISVRYKPRTGQVYRAHWRTLARFLEEADVAAPLLLERRHCFEFVTWRTGDRKQKSGRKPRVNTAIGELKLLAQIIDEAKKRRLCRGDNPARKLGLERESVIAKPEINDREIEIIFKELADRPEWMQRSFNLALRTGLRFAETRIERSQIDWGERVIQIERPKGGRGRAFSIPIYKSIEPMLREWQASGRHELWTVDKGTLTGLEWSKFFRDIGLPHLCFHCTRVTFISRGARAGIPEGMMMKLVNHASSEVHRIYQRLPPGDAAKLVEAIAIPSAPAAKGRNQRGK